MSIGIAVIGAGMAGRAHANAYRVAPTLYEPTLPPLRFISIADVNAELGTAAARRYGYERSDMDWRAIADDPAIDVVSVAVDNSKHMEVVGGLLDAGKHVLCEKPLADNLLAAREMVHRADEATSIARIGMTYRRQPGIAAMREWIVDGTLGRVLRFSGRYWCDYGCSPKVPMSWRYKGAPGSGALADLGSHLADIAEFLCGPIESVSGAAFSTIIRERPKPLGVVVGHGVTAVSDAFEPVENDDSAVFVARFGACTGSLDVSRVAAGYANGLDLQVFCENGAARFEQESPSRLHLYRQDDAPARNGFRAVNLGSEHPYVAGGMAIDGAGVGFGQNEGFIYQARAFLEEVAGIDGEGSLPPNASFADGLHNMELLGTVAESAANGGSAVAV